MESHTVSKLGMVHSKIKEMHGRYFNLKTCITEKFSLRYDGFLDMFAQITFAHKQ